MTRHPSRPSPVVLVVLVGIFLAGCRSPVNPPPSGRIWELTDSGVVEAVEESDAGTRVTLAGGETVALGPGTFRNGGGQVEPGELLLAGTSPSGGLAYTTLHGLTDGCYYLEDPAVDDGTHVLFESGFRIPKSPNFDPGPIDDGRFPSHREGFCINAAGEVVRYGS